MQGGHKWSGHTSPDRACKFRLPALSHTSNFLDIHEPTLLLAVSHSKITFRNVNKYVSGVEGAGISNLAQLHVYIYSQGEHTMMLASQTGPVEVEKPRHQNQTAPPSLCNSFLVYLRMFLKLSYKGCDNIKGLSPQCFMSWFQKLYKTYWRQNQLQRHRQAKLLVDTQVTNWTTGYWMICTLWSWYLQSFSHIPVQPNPTSFTQSVSRWTIRLSVVCLSPIHPSVYIHQSVYPAIYQDVHPSIIHPSIRLHVHPFTCYTDENDRPDIVGLMPSASFSVSLDILAPPFQRRHSRTVNIDAFTLTRYQNRETEPFKAANNNRWFQPAFTPLVS